MVWTRLLVDSTIHRWVKEKSPTFNFTNAYPPKIQQNNNESAFGSDGSPLPTTIQKLYRQIMLIPQCPCSKIRLADSIIDHT